MDEKIFSKLKDLSFDELKEVSKKAINFYISFLREISDEEDEELAKKMEEFIAGVKEIYSQREKFERMEEKEKIKIIQDLIKDYHQKLMAALTPENRERLKNGLKKIVEEIKNEKNPQN